jgi:hypothetical protein
MVSWGARIVFQTMTSAFSNCGINVFVCARRFAATPLPTHPSTAPAATKTNQLFRMR